MVFDRSAKVYTAALCLLLLRGVISSCLRCVRGFIGLAEHGGGGGGGGSGSGKNDRVVLFEIVLTWISSVMLYLVGFGGGSVSANASRVIGVVFLVMYLAFLVLEFIVFRR